MKILIIGVNTRHIACSARQAGHIVFSLDSFGDIDLKSCCEKLLILDIPDLYDFETDKVKSRLVPLIKSMLPVDAVVLGPGFEHEGNWIREITESKVQLLNNSTHVFTNVSDKVLMAEKLKSLNIPHPYTVPMDLINIPDDWKKEYPVVIKPRCGAGGMKNIPVKDKHDLKLTIDEIKDYKDQYLLQEYVSGIIASVSVISTGKKAMTVAVNKHLAGVKGLTEMPFAYCGNITPYLGEYNEWMCRIAVDLALKMELVGSIGVDFIISDNRQVVLEVNPRIQGSIDTVELSTGLNIFQAHYNAFNGILPEIEEAPNKYKCYSIRTIFFTPNEISISDDIFNFLIQYFKQGKIADIPAKGTILHRNEPVVSFISDGNSKIEVIHKAQEFITDLKIALS
jgi:hypothetical protein